jgi:prephenate dehydrogenase
MPIRQITIFGTGLIGGSLGLALRKKKFPGQIIGCDRESALERAARSTAGRPIQETPYAAAS